MAWIKIDNHLIDQAEIVAITKPVDYLENYKIILRGGAQLVADRKSEAESLWKFYAEKAGVKINPK